MNAISDSPKKNDKGQIDFPVEELSGNFLNFTYKYLTPDLVFRVYRSQSCHFHNVYINDPGKMLPAL